jgi:protein arginine kinase activator
MPGTDGERAMKCQRCAKQSAYHITEVLDEGRFEELHLCEDCAKKHLYEPPPAPPPASGYSEPPSPADLGAKACDVCGLKFVEFRNAGRLGCPHDYDAFQDELLPLLDNIHGDTKHAGKTPRRRPAAQAQERELAALKKQLQQAITAERYEEAARLRDAIKQAEAAGE